MNNAAKTSGRSAQIVRYCGEIVTVIGASGTDVLIVCKDGEMWVRGRDLSYTGPFLVCEAL